MVKPFSGSFAKPALSLILKKKLRALEITYIVSIPNYNTESPQVIRKSKN